MRPGVYDLICAALWLGVVALAYGAGGADDALRYGAVAFLAWSAGGMRYHATRPPGR
jgi:hypothetical protein